MIILCLGLVIGSVLLFMGPPHSRRVAQRLADSSHVATVFPQGSHRRRWGWSIGWVLALLALWVTHQRAGAPATVVGMTVVIVLATSLRLGFQSQDGRAADRSRLDVAHACSVLASQIRVGRVPAEALHSAAADCPVLGEASRAQDLGGDVTEVLHACSAVPGQGGLADLARAWDVSNQTGAPMAGSLEQVAEGLSEDLALRAVVAGELSAPRATGKIMAVLPFCGLGMGYLLGGDPLAFLLAGPAGWLCLVVGMTLAALGVLWIDRLARLSVGSR